MNWIIICCALLVFITSTVIAMDFSLKGDPCSKFDSCYSKPLLRTCSCDSKCHLYGTCCHDAKSSLDPQAAVPFHCYSNRTIIPVFAKRSCSKDFNGHEGYLADCFDDEIDDVDVKSHILVTSHKTKVTYWNERCAICNHEAEEDLEFWNIEVFCPQRKEVDRNLIKRNLTFDEMRRQWGLYIGEDFLKCSVKYAPPPYFDEVNHCTPKVISNCPPDYNQKGIVKKCSQFYGERKLKDANIHYKNIYCALCNGVSRENLVCPGLGEGVGDNIDETDFREMVEEVFTRGEWRRKEKGNPSCSKGFLYDIFRKKCRRDQKPAYLTATDQNCARTSSLSILLLVVLTILSAV